jgi:hypothetical protein
MASAEGPARAHGTLCRSSLETFSTKPALQSTISTCPETMANNYTDRHGRRRPFSNWMKRLANLKSSNAESGATGFSHKRNNIPMTIKSKKSSIPRNNPYPLSGKADPYVAGHLSFSAPLSSPRSRHSSVSQSRHSISASHDSQAQVKSRAPTLSTTAETATSDAANSKAGTSATAAKTDGDRNSTFSSPATSVRSMTTTLTTVQSAGPPLNAHVNTTATGGAVVGTIGGGAIHPSNNYSTQFPASPPITAVPAHLAPHTHPVTYNSAIANNVLTDDASILTLASSSKRRRRNSLDTNASIRALAPASMFGGSRESLPLSVLSSSIADPSNTSAGNASGALQRNPGMAAERASLISSSGIAPALVSERNSYLGKQGDGASIRSGLLGGGHGRNDSFTNSLGGGTPNTAALGSPLASSLAGAGPGMVAGHQGRNSRQSSAWDENADENDDGN